MLFPLVNKRKNKFKLELNVDYHSPRFFAAFLPAIYLVAVSIFCLEYHLIPGPEFLGLGILLMAGYNRRVWPVVRDWLPFITVFISYEILNSFVGNISKYNLHVGPHNLELEIFGQIPSLLLQQNLRMPILDYTGALYYSLFFFVPTVFAFILWRKNPKNYGRYTVAFGICTYGALTTFLFYPVAPPWIAVSNVTRILTGSVDVSLGIPVYRTLLDFLGPNLYAAFPSMHSALPWLVFLFSFKIWKWKSLPVLLLPVGTWFSAVYLGEHYVVDVLGGATYATVAFFVVEKILPAMSKRVGFLKKCLPI